MEYARCTLQDECIEDNANDDGQIKSDEHRIAQCINEWVVFVGHIDDAKERVNGIGQREQRLNDREAEHEGIHSDAAPLRHKRGGIGPI